MTYSQQNKKNKPDSIKSLWSDELAQEYERANYGTSLAGFVMRRSHALIEKDFSSEKNFDRVLEVGAGSGIHINSIQHSFREYWMTDMSKPMLDQIEKNTDSLAGHNTIYAVEDAANLSFEDASFDRIIASHVLEHIYKPHEVLLEWQRVLRPGGVLSLVLPCDPGMMWRLGRYLGPRRAAHKKGIDYDFTMALEHVNSITNLVAIIRHLFTERDERWWPFSIPNTDLNLIYTVNITTDNND